MTSVRLDEVSDEVRSAVQAARTEVAALHAELTRYELVV